MFQPQATNSATRPPQQSAELPAQIVSEPPPKASGEAEPAAAEPKPERKPKQRDPFFDNAKYLAIVLVAMGHSWEPLLSGSRTTEALYSVVYAFHMPAFIIISGYFSRSFTGRPEQIKRLVTGVAVPYIVFETAYSLFKRYVDDTAGHPVSLTDPWYLTWFLAALFIWRLTTPLWRAVRWPLPLALAIAALASTSPSIGDDLDLQRVFQFLPYFVVGLCMKPEHFDIVRRRAVRIMAVPVFAFAVVFAYWSTSRVSCAWLYHRDSAQQLGAPWYAGPMMVLALFGCSLLLTACFFALVPRRDTWFTVLGAGTLCGYLLHGFLVKGVKYAGVYHDYHWLHSPLGEVTVTLTAGVAMTLLCTPPIRKVFRPVMEPEMAWAFLKPRQKPEKQPQDERQSRPQEPSQQPPRVKHQQQPSASPTGG
jgi:fucose 4-O-acetylase-like acetyltransferase